MTPPIRSTGIFSGLPGCPESASSTALHKDGVIYFGGSFQSPYNHVAAYTIADGSWANVGTGLDAAVDDLVVLGDTLYAIGTFATPILHVAQIALTPSIGVDEEKESSIHVYPSPFQDELYFTGSTGLNTVILYDISGKVVLQETTNESRINTSGLAPGLYVLELNGEKVSCCEGMRYAKRNIQNFYSIVVLLFNEIGDSFSFLSGKK